VGGRKKIGSNWPGGREESSTGLFEAKRKGKVGKAVELAPRKRDRRSPKKSSHLGKKQKKKKKKKEKKKKKKKNEKYGGLPLFHYLSSLKKT